MRGEKLAALLILATAWLSVVTPIAAQETDAYRRIAGYKHRSWTADDGAPRSISSLTQSSDGFIWMVGDDGVYRFDGLSFEKMPGLSDPVLGEFQPLVVYAAANGDVWIGYRPGAVAVYRRGRLYNLHMPNPPEFVTVITEDKRGGMWVVSGRETHSLARYKAGRWEEIGEAQGVSGQIGHLMVDRLGITWIVQREKISYRPVGSERFVETPAFVVPGTYRLAQSPDGRRWLADQGGLRPLPDYPAGATDPARPSTGRNGKPLRFTFDREGNLWGWGTTRGAVMVPASRLSDPKMRTQPDLLTASEGLSSDGTTSMFVDREDNIWIGTNGGLDKLRKTIVRLQDGLGPVSSAYAGATDAAGTTYIEDDLGIHAIGRDGKVTKISDETGLISAPCRLFDGSVVTLTASAVIKLQPNGVRPVGPGPKEVSAGCAGDASGRLWSDLEVPSWLDRAGWHGLPLNGSPVTVGGLTMAPWGVTLMRLSGTGLMRLDPTKPVTIPASTFRVGALFSVEPGIRDVLIGGSQGLARLRGGEVRTIDSGRHPWLRKLRALAQTRSGDTWMQSPVGIMRVRTSDLDRAFETAGAPLPHDLFDSADGLVSYVQKNGLWGAQILDGSDGIVRFLTASGVVAIDPRRITRNPLPPPVTIRSLISGSATFLDPSTVELHAGRAPITIAFSALSLAVPERVSVRYRLEGYDDDWIDPRKRRDAVYGNLAPGTYRFRVIAANNDGVWNRKGATLSLTVLPAFYQTTWFLCLCILAGGVLLWWIYALRVRQLTARMQAAMGVRMAERERIARELHDTLLQSFQGLVLQFQAAANRLVPGGPANEALDRALRSADDALIEGRNRVRELRADDNDRDWTEAWVALASRLGASRSARFEFTMEGSSRPLHPLVQEEVQRLGEEAIRNAYEHAQASIIEVIVGYRMNSFDVAIRDNGIGLPDDVVSKGGRDGHYGLTGMRERAQRVGGVLSVSTQKGIGTQIRVSVPAKAAYRLDRRPWTNASLRWFGRR